MGARDHIRATFTPELIADLGSDYPEMIAMIRKNSAFDEVFVQCEKGGFGDKEALAIALTSMIDTLAHKGRGHVH